MAEKTVTVYYDGLCPVCAREVAHYRQHATDEMVFVDIAATDFDAAQHGIDGVHAQKVLHVKVGEDMRTGIDAAIAIWQALPAYRWLGRLMNLPGIHLLARIGYRVFASIRPYLQRRGNRICTDDTCRNLKTEKSDFAV